MTWWRLGSLAPYSPCPRACHAVETVHEITFDACHCRKRRGNWEKPQGEGGGGKVLRLPWKYGKSERLEARKWNLIVEKGWGGNIGEGKDVGASWPRASGVHINDPSVAPRSRLGKKW